MDSVRIRFWLKLALVVMTSFIVITYIFRPSNNQCQMTFMMEPPRFIPIPIDIPLHKLDADSSINVKHSTRHKYKLFMYSEFGFPLENDIRRDLKDSMPVLFVPGNAGSYQQVRSLASTCIRRQLQSLDAFKFIFYTIDFQAQLSGLSGDLVGDQIEFLNLAINQIAGLHPSETNGVIVIGHSVGGFVAKALLTRSNFNTDLVPLLINLASPLTRPFVNFDYKMHQLYKEISSKWPKQQHRSNTLTVSISGGISDRLVPLHLSLDTQYDISLTTSSIDDVWQTTDHVSITWCKELMNKLSRLLSALMDKRHTRLIEGKAQQLAVVKDELITQAIPYGLQMDYASANKEPKLLNSNNVIKIDHNFSATRGDLLESSIILNLTARSGGDLFVWLEHIDFFKESALFGCQDVVFSLNQARCDGKVNLIEHFRKIPTRRFELKKRTLLIRDDSQKLKYIILDFATHLRDDPRKHKIPEYIGIQVIKKLSTQILQVPTLSSYLLSRILKPSSLVIDIHASVKQPKTYGRYELVNLNQANQYFNMIIEPLSCATGDTPHETSALLIQDEYVEESFYANEKTATVKIRLNSQRTLLLDNSKNQSKSYLELYFDGSCTHRLRIELDIWTFVENLIQNYLGEILACSCYIAYCSVLSHANLFLKVQSGSIVTNSFRNLLTKILGYVVIYLLSRLNDSSSSDPSHQIILFFGISILSSGLVALVEYVVNRLVDLATIFNNFQTLIGDKIVRCCANGTYGNDKTATLNGLNDKTDQIKPGKLEYEWPVVFLTALGGLFLSEALMRLCVMFMLLKFMLKLSISKPQPVISTETNGARSRRAQYMPALANNQVFDCAYNLTLGVTTLCIISSICSIPTILLMVNSTGISLLIDSNYIASLVTMIMVKSINQMIESYALVKTRTNLNTMLQRLLTFIPRYFLIVSLLPMSFVSRNIRVTNYMELVILISIAGSLSRSRNEVKKRKSD